MLNKNIDSSVCLSAGTLWAMKPGIDANICNSPCCPFEGGINGYPGIREPSFKLQTLLHN
jgi:hypothetical protein